MKNKLFNIANMPKCGYSSLALGKISKLALTGYNEKGVQPTLTSGFFVRFSPMRSHIYASREGRTSSDVLVTFFTSLSTDPFGLHQSNDSDVQAFNQEKGAHSHA